MEENFTKVLEELETCKKKVHKDKMENQIKNISVSNIFFPEFREKTGKQEEEKTSFNVGVSFEEIESLDKYFAF